MSADEAPTAWERSGRLHLSTREIVAVSVIAESMRRAFVRRLPPELELVDLEFELRRRASRIGERR